MITLEQLLESRDRRAAHQRTLLEANPECCLVCLTVQPPGTQKRTASSLLIGGAGMAALLDRFGKDVRYAQVRDLETGYEAYLLLPMPALAVKRICCGIEDSHPLGRLMDIDVLQAPATPLSRPDIGLGPRRCLLCGQEARVCMRARTHSQAELLEKIDEMVDSFLNP